MSNPKWCTKHSQYAHDCSDCLRESKERETELNTQLTNAICRAEAAERDFVSANAALAIARGGLIDLYIACTLEAIRREFNLDAARVEKV